MMRSGERGADERISHYDSTQHQSRMSQRPPSYRGRQRCPDLKSLPWAAPNHKYLLRIA